MSQVSNSPLNETPVLLELFSGTGSVGRSFRARGWEVFSVDIDAAAKPTLVANVLDLQLDALPPRVDWIWASPWRVLFWWGGCAVATVVVMLFALYDALLVFREERSKDR